MTGKPKTQGPLAMIVARNTSDLRRKTNMTAAGLSRLLYAAGTDIPVLGLRRLEGGRRNITVDEAAALANVFGLQISDIVRAGVVDSHQEEIIRWVLENSR